MTNSQSQVSKNLIAYFRHMTNSVMLTPNQSIENGVLVMAYSCEEPSQLSFSVEEDGSVQAYVVTKFGCTFNTSFSSTEAMSINSKTDMPAGILMCIRSLIVNQTREKKSDD